MDSHPDAPLRPSRLAAVFGGAMALIVCACGIVIVWVVSVASISLDHTQAEGERRLVNSVLQDTRKSLVKTVNDYASWSELVHYLDGPRRPAWERDNLGPYITNAFGISRIYIVSEDGKIVYDFRRSQPGGTPPSTKMQSELAAVARMAFAAEVPGKAEAVSGVVDLDGLPVLIAAATIRDSAMVSKGRFVLLEGFGLGRNHLKEISSGYGIDDLHAKLSKAGGLALTTPSGAVSSFRLSWRPSHAGHALLMHVLPTLLLVGLAGTLGFLALAIGWWRVIELTRQSEARALRAEVQASRTRAAAAEDTSRSKSAFIANMSHELRTPLNAIIGFSEFMALETLGPIGLPKYREYAGHILDSGRHLLALVNDLLQASKIEAGKFTPRLEAVSLGDALGDAVAMVEVLAAKHDITLDLVRCPDNADALVDRQAFQQILLNILSNAVKFSLDGGRVELGCKVLADCCEVRVRDEGCGIPQETLKELGKPFVQAEEVYARKHQGTGLGLAISFQLAEALGGSIAIDSTVGYGTTVTLRLPRAESQRDTRPQKVSVAAE